MWMQLLIHSANMVFVWLTYVAKTGNRYTGTRFLSSLQFNRHALIKTDDLQWHFKRGVVNKNYLSFEIISQGSFLFSLLLNKAAFGSSIVLVFSGNKTLPKLVLTKISYIYIFLPHRVPWPNTRFASKDANTGNTVQYNVIASQITGNSNFCSTACACYSTVEQWRVPSQRASHAESISIVWRQLGVNRHLLEFVL